MSGLLAAREFTELVVFVVERRKSAARGTSVGWIYHVGASCNELNKAAHQDLRLTPGCKNRLNSFKNDAISKHYGDNFGPISGHQGQLVSAAETS